ncbi:MAG: NlpC/P60 family protein [Deltaproteobacteria bacterium]
MRNTLYLFILFVSLCVAVPVASAERMYTVKKGDTLPQIAKKFGVTTTQIKKQNSLYGNVINRGQLLVIPAKPVSTAKIESKQKKRIKPVSSVYVVKRGDTLSRIAKKAGVSSYNIAKWNGLQGNKLKQGQRLVLKKTRKDNDGFAEVPRSKAKHEVADISHSESIKNSDTKAPIVEQEVADSKVEDTNRTNSYIGVWEYPNEQGLLVKVARGFIGTPYRFGGSSVKGIDCSGFVAKIYQMFDVDLPRSARQQAQIGKQINKNELKEGDLVFFRTARGTYGHVGIYVGNNEFIHAPSHKRNGAVMVSSLNEQYFNQRFVIAIRIKKESPNNNLLQVGFPPTTPAVTIPIMQNI